MLPDSVVMGFFVSSAIGSMKTGSMVIVPSAISVQQPLLHAKDEDAPPKQFSGGRKRSQVLAEGYCDPTHKNLASRDVF